MTVDEISIKMKRLTDFLDRHQLDGVLLHRRNNFAWITGGRDNHIANSSPSGVAYLLATRNQRVCFTNTIEAPRFADEELAGTGIEVVSYPWYDAAKGRKALQDLIAGRKIAADVNDSGDFNALGAGLLPLPADFNELRWSLTEAEMIRYRDGGRRTAFAIEQACMQIKPGMSEHEIAGMLDLLIHASGCNPVVTLVAADERVRRFRHPIPTTHKLQDYVMLVTCAEFAGLISNCTRFVSFKPLSQEIQRKQQAVANVDAAVNLATRPGRTLGEIFATLEKAYAEQGYPEEWTLHHQGGSTGYNGRDVFATPGSPVKVLDHQAFAWNPSITGTKSEDTILCTSRGIEFLTQASNDWPKLQASVGKESIERPAILVR